MANNEVINNNVVINDNEVINDVLGYEGLKIIQRPDAFRFSLDSVLLANFVNINLRDKKALDLGTGNGAIPLLLSTRSKMTIYGVEIQADIASMAMRSVGLNKLDDQIKILQADAKTVHQTLGIAQFDIITCNPPYFPYQETSICNKNDYLTLARHEVCLTLEDLLQASNRLLKDGGKLAIVHRSERLIDIIQTFRQAHFEIKRLQFVYSKKNSANSLIVLVEAIKAGKAGNLQILKPLYIYKADNTYTKEAKKIFGYED